METIQNFPAIAKKDFPLLNKNLKSHEQIIYLDHAATNKLFFLDMKTEISRMKIINNKYV